MTIDETDRVAQLRTVLSARAHDEGILDVGWDVVASPFGDLLVCASEAGVLRVALPAEDHDAALATVAARVSPRVLRSARRVDAVRAQLAEYFEGRRQRVDVPVDWQLTSEFRQRALTAVAAVPYGTTATYREVATAAGSPGAVRAAGTACARNPVPLVVPCHRVVRTGGQLGEYAGGAAMKRDLLALERAPHTD